MTTTGGGAGTEETGATEGAKVIDLKSMDNAKGDVTICMGKDTGGDVTTAVKSFNAQNNGVTAKLLEFSTSADEQRQQFVQRQEAKSGECDVFSADVIWTAEFASQKWLYDLTPYIDTRKDELIEATLETATFDGKVWGMPQQTDAGFLYYRTDQVTEKPATWQDVYKQAADKDGIVYQGNSYEGLTCNFLELAFAAGGKVLSDDGKKSEINSPENVKALKLMADNVKNGTRRAASRRTWRRSRGATSRAARRPSCATGRTPTRSARRPRRSRTSSTSCPSRTSRAAARPASSAVTTRSSPSTRRTPAAR